MLSRMNVLLLLLLSKGLLLSRSRLMLSRMNVLLLLTIKEAADADATGSVNTLSLS